MNTYLQAAIHNLKAVGPKRRSSSVIAIGLSSHQLPTLSGLGKNKLAEEEERGRTLEAELARNCAEAIAEYKASQEFEDLPSAEYDSSFPDTFKTC